MLSFVDLSIPIENEVVSDPPPHGPRITYYGHYEAVGQLLPFFPGLKAEDLPDGEAWQGKRMIQTCHTQ